MAGERLKKKPWRHAKDSRRTRRSQHACPLPVSHHLSRRASLFTYIHVSTVRIFLHFRLRILSQYTEHSHVPVDRVWRLWTEVPYATFELSSLVANGISSRSITLTILWNSMNYDHKPTL